MGNECDQCEAVTEGCKRQQFRTQLKNRQKLDISRAQANQKSRSKLQPLLQMRNNLVTQHQINQQNSQSPDMHEDSSIQVIKHRKPPNQLSSVNITDITPTFKESLNMKSSLKEKKQQIDSKFESMKYQQTSELRQAESHDDLNFIKLPIESGIEGKSMKKLEELERALMMSREPGKVGSTSLKNKKPSETSSPLFNANSIVHIQNPIQESMNEKQNDKQNSLMKKNSMRNDHALRKIQSGKYQEEIEKPIAMKKTKSSQIPASPKQKHSQNYMQPDTINLDSQNPSKVLRQFNNSLQQSPIPQTKHQPKSPIDYEQSELPYDQQSFTQPLETVQQHAFYLKTGVYFEGYISSVTKTLENQGTIKFRNDHTEMLCQFRNGEVNVRKNAMLGFGDGSVFDGAVKKDTEKSEFMACGEGKFVMQDESYYVGEWLKNLPHGKGVHRFADGSCYEGEFIEGRKQGQGKFTTAEQDLIYQGFFLNNRIEGFGKMFIIEPNTGKKRIYKGYFKNGKLEGDNCQVQYVEEKAKYVGSFHDGKKSGKGKYFYGDGRTWEGEWKENRQNGYGKFRNLQGLQIEGYWVDGIKSQGRMSKR